jgi:phosphoglycolate phosphatase-like HAD superfamily hydrolase
MIRVALFDIDGTLIRTRGAGQRAFGAAFESEFGLADACSETDFAGRTDRGLAADILAANHLEPSTANIQRVFKGYLRWLAQFLPTDHCEPLPDVQALIDGLRDLPKPPIIALLTGNHSQGAKLKLVHFNLWHEFAWGAFGETHEARDDVAHHALELARDKLGADLNPADLLVIGDTERDIQCARAIGARVLAVATGMESMDELAGHQPDFLVKDLSEITPVELT